MSSIRDVARLARVSPATVSRVLNNDQTYKTTPETRQNVLKAVTELDYKPLIKKHSKANVSTPNNPKISIGCLLVSTKGKYSDPYYLSILAGIEQELEKLNGAVTSVHTTQELENPMVLESLLNAQLDGLVMMRPLDEPLFKMLHSRIPHIVGTDIGHMPIDSIEYDHERVSKMAVDYLYQKGHRQIGFIGSGSGGFPITKSRRCRSYMEALQDHGLEINHEWILDCEWDDKQCMKLVEGVIKTGHYPTAFYAASDLMAMAALRSLFQAGIRVPDQVAVMGMSNIEMSQYANPPLTTIDVPTNEIGIAVARVIVNRIQGDTTLPKHILLPSTLIVRDSA